MEEPSGKAYGDGRTRPNVSYAEVERAAITLLKSERRPTIETIRETLGRGAPETIGNALKRFWRDLGVRIEGDPAALTRMPPDIADLADGLWQRALKLASDAAAQDDNAARQRLAQLQHENEVRAQSWDLRERELDAGARAREKALADSREHLLLLMKSLAREQETVRAQETRIADLEQQLSDSQVQPASLITAAVVRHRKVGSQKASPTKAPKSTGWGPRRRKAPSRKASLRAPTKRPRVNAVRKSGRRERK